MANTYFDILNAVENYYGAGSDQWTTIANYGMAAEDAASILKQVPNVSYTINEAGAVTSWAYGAEVSGISSGMAAAAETAQAINSNTAVVADEVLSVPANFTKDAITGEVGITSGAKVAATGTTLETVLGHAATALIGTGIGLKLGVWVDGALYNAAPDFWDSHNLSEIDPEKWKDYPLANLALKNSGYDQFMYLIDGEGNTYIDEGLYAYYAAYLNQQGAFSNFVTCAKDRVEESLFINPDGVPDSLIVYDTPTELPHHPTASSPLVWHCRPTSYTDHVFFAKVNNLWNWVSDEPFTYVLYDANDDPYMTITGTEKTVGSDTFYVASTGIGGVPIDWQGNTVPYYTGMENDIEILMKYGTEIESSIDGINRYDDTPVLPMDATLAEILDLLKNQYPDLWNDQLNLNTLNDDGTITERHYIPFVMPSGGTETQPQSRPSDVPEPGESPNPQTKQQERIAGNSTPTDPTKPSDGDSGKGDTPVIVPPTGSADALYKIYNPTLTQIQQFGAWLWSPSFVDQILKMFNDPMEAIISLHKIYATPHTEANEQPIKVGYLSSGVMSKVVDEQYIDVDCGSININETFGNVFDYNSIISLYLPFIGIVSLNVADVMRGKMGIVYHIDVITGVVLVDVSITRDNGAGGVLYQYTGSCAEQYPLSSGSYMGIATGILSIAAGIAGTVATGGAAAPMLLGAAAAVGSMHTRIERSNGFSGNAGAMGCKKPYLIIERPITARALNDQHMIGYPANAYVTVNSCTGYTKALKIYTDDVSGATDEEKTEIKSLFENGVIV